MTVRCGLCQTGDHKGRHRGCTCDCQFVDGVGKMSLRLSESDALDMIAKEFEWIDTIGNGGLTRGDLSEIRRAVVATGRLGRP